MKAIVSPAKKLNEKAVFPEDLKFSEPVFIAEAQKLMEKLRRMTPQEIAEFMEISDKMAEENYRRFQAWTPEGQIPAVYLYNGDTYRGLDINSFPTDKLENLQNSLRIISGLYGILRPLDLISPYRLEMKRVLAADGYKDLQSFWRDRITRFLREDLNGEPLVVLSSKEYASAVDFDKLGAPVYFVDFKDNRNGKLRTMGLFAKRARGNMARWIAENNITEPGDLKAFDGLGYQYNPELSAENRLVFVR